MGQETVTAITFAQVRKLVKQGRFGDSKLLESLDRIAGVLLLISGATTTPGALSLLGAKNELTKLGQATARKLLNRGSGDFLDRSRRLAAAHCLLTHTAFLTALERHLPDLMATIALTDAEKRGLPEDSTFLDLAIALPHPAHTNANRRRDLHLHLAARFQHFVRGLAHGHRDREVTEGVAQAMAAAEEIYQAQYLELLHDSPDFAAWSAHQSQQRIDRGLQDLATRIDALHPNAQSDATAADLSTVYGHRLADPVFGDGSPTGGLAFPSKQDAFIPQSFKVIRQQSTDPSLEHEPRWAGLPVREDLGDFLLDYLNSPYSTESPLLVLGHPGSGKSLLTEVLAARLAAPAFTTVRVELRDTNPETDFQDQLETQIKRDTGRTTNWSEFAATRAANPPLIILDGYDELLQANGKVFADYLTRAAAFQTRESRLNRPVRILITSRLTLIDKATLPPDLTVLRLLEFDRPRQRLWAETWTRHNPRPFTVPTNPALTELAEQPLLLLMLAIYDATVKPLAEAETLSRTDLYHSLITEFIRRERAKDPANPTPDLTPDLNRLGVAAIGMFNRQSVHLSGADLNADLAFFTGAHTPEGPGRHLTQAELLVGSFFFIHESRAEDAKAYEFLHNTFGEFLTADFLLRQVIRETTTVTKLAADEALRPALDTHLATLSPQWFASLKHAPLHARPQILRLFGEWAAKRVDLEAFDRILHHELRATVYSPDAQSLTTRHDADPYPRNAILAHQATYTLNLVLLRLTLAGGRHQLPEHQIGPPDLAHGTWDRLAHLWRAWFSPESLGQLGSILYASRTESTIYLSLNETRSQDSPTGLALAHTGAQALADHLTMGLIGHASLGAGGADYIETSLAKAGISLPEQLAVLRARKDPAVLQHAAWFPREIVTDGMDHVHQAFEILQRTPGEFTTPVHDILPGQLTSLSRAEATTVIDFLARFDPAWLPYITDPATSVAPLFLTASPMVAPLLNAFLRNGDPHHFAHIAREVAAGFSHTAAPDAQTAIAFAALGDAGNQPGLSTTALTTLLDHPADDLLLALPQPTLDELTHLLLSSSPSELRRTIADRLAGESSYLEELLRINPPELLPRLSQAVRITGPQHEFTPTLLTAIGKVTALQHPWPVNRLLLRALRENDHHKQVFTTLKAVTSGTSVLPNFGLHPLHRHRDVLTAQDLDDLRWAALILGGQDAHRDLLAQLREHGLE